MHQALPGIVPQRLRNRRRAASTANSQGDLTRTELTDARAGSNSRGTAIPQGPE